MSRATFYKLCDQLQLCLQKLQTIMREPLAIDTRVAMTLYCLADEGRYQKLANSFGIGRSLVSVVLKEVMRIISAKVRSKNTRFPSINEETEQAVNNFSRKYHRFPQCLGTVDCTYINMKQPLKNYTDYICRKGQHSINAKAICDYRYRFNDVVIKWPGSVRDARVFTNSNLNKKCRDGTIPHCSKVIVEDEISFQFAF